MKRIFLAALLTVACAPGGEMVTPPVTLPAGPDRIVRHDTRAEFLANPSLVAGEYVVGDFTATLTPAPKGYKPVYISHFGRHGARYALGNDFYERIANFLEKAHTDGKLTDIGEDLYRRYMAFYPSAAYRGGDLTRIGVRQEQEIAETMFRSFPEVFRGETRAVATSTMVPRVIMTMASFMDAMDDLDRSFDGTMDTGRNYLDILDPHTDAAPNYVPVVRRSPEGQASYAAFRKERIDEPALASRFVNDPDYLEANYGTYRFIFNIRTLSVSMACIDPALADAFSDLYSFEELYAFWEVWNYGGYLYMGHSPYSDKSYIDRIRPTLETIISEADADLASSEVQLRLRFAHDSGIFGLVGLMEVDNFGAVVEDPHDVADYWRCSEVPMGSNLQFVFYRKTPGFFARLFRRPVEGEILFKLLFNGHEASLPLEPVTGPYYRWEDFRARFGKQQ